MRLRFSLPTLIFLLSLAAWLIAVAQPGGIYIHLPLGVAVLLVCVAVMSVVRLRRAKTKRWKHWLSLISSACLFTAIVLFYPLFWSLALNRYEFEQFVRNQRQYIINEMPAEEVRDAGRRLYAELQKVRPEERFLPPGSQGIPKQISALKPRYVWAHPEYLFVYLGRRKQFYALRIYPEGSQGSGGIRLAPGIWYVPGRDGPLY